MSQSIPPCPYVGLQPFAEADRAYFFGRAEEQETIAANLISAPLTLLYGASGVGKSSVLNAGVVPYLRTLPEVTVITYRTWQDATFRDTLKSIIRREEKRTPTDDDARWPLDELIVRATRGTPRMLAIILDQFEEYFLYHPESEQATLFDEEFARAVNRADVQAHFVISIREDALSRLDRFQGRIPGLMSNYLRLEHLNRAGAERAMREPLRVYNAARPGEPPIAIEDTLVDALIEQVQTGRVTIGHAGRGGVGARLEPGDARIETPFLQMVLTRLWDETIPPTPSSRVAKATERLGLRLATLERLGGAEKIVRTHLDDVMTKLNARDQQVCSFFFDRLITPSGTKIAQMNDDLVAYAALPGDQVAPILKSLVDARVLRTVAPPMDQPIATRYEIFHDVLAPAVLDWRRRFIEQQTRRQERARLRRLRLGLIGTLALVFVFAALAWFAFQQQRVGFSRELAAGSIANISFDPELGILLATESVNRVYTLEGENSLHQALLNSFVRFAIRGHTGWVRSAAYSPDGKQIVSASDDLTARVWDAATGRELSVLRGHTGTVNQASYSPNGKQIVTASDDQTARVWDAATSRAVTTLRGHSDQVRSAIFSPDGKQITTTSNDQTVRVWDASTGRELRVLRGHTRDIFTAAYSPDGLQIATASYDKTVRVWDATTGQSLKVISDTEPIFSAAYSPDGQKIVAATGNGSSRVLDLKTGKLMVYLIGHSSTVWSAVYSPDGAQILTSSADRTARVFDATTGRELKVLRGHTDRVSGASYRPDGQRIVTASFDESVRVWDTAESEVAVLRGHTDGINSVVYSFDGKQILTASNDATARVWDALTGNQVTLLRGHAGYVISAAFRPDAKQIVTGSEDGTARIWDAVSGRQLNVLRADAGVVNSAAFNPNGKQIVTANEDGTVRLWDADTGRALFVLRGDKTTAFSALFSPDGNQIVAGYDDGTARTWQVATGRALVTLRGHTDWVNSATYSPDGKQIATASSDRTARVWDAATGRVLEILRGHTDWVRTATFSPDGKRIVTSSGDGSARVWDAQTGYELTVLRGHLGGVLATASSPDGKHIVTAGGDGTLRIYLARIDDLLELARTRVTRALACEERQKYLHEDLICSNTQ